MFALDLDCKQEEKDLLIAELWEEGSAGIAEVNDAGLRAFFADDFLAADLLHRFAHRGARLGEVEQRDWVAFSRAKWEPFEVGSRFFLVPRWRTDPAPPGRLRIEINPGLACGTGYHPATQLCLEALERHAAPGVTALDIGTGSGILSIASILLGVQRVLACDLDPVAVEIARENFRTAGAGISLFTGSADAVRSNTIDLAVANISGRVIAALAPELRRVMKRGARAILSGFEIHESGEVRESLSRDGASVQEEQRREAWTLLIAK